MAQNRQRMAEAEGAAIPAINALLLDDSQFDRARIRRIATRAQLGLNLDEASTLEELSERLHERPYDLILLDYHLPQGNGIAALAVIENEPQNRGAAKLLISGQAEKSIAIHAMRSGCHDVLGKDELTENALQKSVAHALRMAKSQRHLQERARLADRMTMAEWPGAPSAHLLSGDGLDPARFLSMSPDEEDEFIFH